MNPVLDGVLADLEAQSAELDAQVSDLTDEQWRTPTPATGWDVATQIAHLAWTDEASVAAATDKTRWDELVLEAMADPENVVDNAALTGGRVPPAELLTRWRAGRVNLAAALRAVPKGEKLPWFGPPMSPTSMATARFMETWAHSQDVLQALGAVGARTDRVVHVVHIGVRTRGFAFAANDLEAPSEPVRVELTLPSGQQWADGPLEATNRVTGSAHDFALLATQRVNRADTDLVAIGAEADKWLDIAQCFAGQPGGGRESTR